MTDIAPAEMRAADPMSATGIDRAEALAVLTELARGKVGDIPPEYVAGHVLGIYPTADWPVLRGALEAILRRCGFAGRDALRIGERPERGAVFGRYRTKRVRQSVRPYETVLASLDPLRASCDCPDFTRSALGLCKHVLTVLDQLAGKPRKWGAALDRADPALGQPHVHWQPIRPLFGHGDWLEGVRFAPGSGARTGRDTELRRLAGRWFTPSAGSDLVLKATHPADPKRRLAVVEAVHELLRRTRRPALAQPALRALIAEEGERLGREIDNLKHLRRSRRRVDALKRALYAYQVEGVDKFLRTGRLLLADDMGLGKTTQAVACCAALFETARVDRGLLIVPASLKPQWEREWHDVCDVPLTVVDGSPDQRAALYRRRRRGFLVVNYEQVIRDLPEMVRFAPQLVVLDEAQRIKNWATKTAACVKQLRVPYRLVLTGTPMENRLSELASIMDWVEDRALEPKWRLVPFHTLVRVDDGRSLPDGSPEKPAVIGARHLDVLRERLEHCMLRRRRPEILSQLPPRTDTVIPVPLTDAQAEEHDALVPPIASLTSKSQSRPLTQPEFLKLMQLLTTQRIIANGLAQLNFADVFPALDRIERPDATLLAGLSSPKLLELRDLVASLVVDQGRKVVVFSQWHRMLRLSRWAIGDVLRRAGLQARFFTGKENSRQRTKNLVEFHDEPSVRVLFCTDAGGVGLNLQHAANCCINLELPWNPAVLEQRIGRIYRLGQEEPVDVFNLVSQGCIEERIAGLVRDKAALFDGLFDGSSEVVEFDRAQGFLDGIRHLVEAPVVPRVKSRAPEPPETLERESAEEVDEMVAAGDETGDALDLETVATTPSEVADLFAEVSVSTTEDGGMRIEASPRAASTLAALFEGMAGMLRQVSLEERGDELARPPGAVPVAARQERAREATP